MLNSQRIVKLMPLAEGDLDDIYDYLCGFSLEIGEKYFNLLLDELFELETNADTYLYCRDERLRQEKVKWKLVNNYMIFFTIHDEENIVLIRRILYSRRNYNDMI